MTAIPTALYRLQLLPDYSFKNLQKLIPKISNLGADTLFLSSIFAVEEANDPKAVAVDFSQCHEKLGTAEDFSILAQNAQEKQIGIVLSVRVSFMQASLKNRLWREVLQRGIHSPYARWFDIDWTPFPRKWVNQILLPILEEPYSKALENGFFEIQLHSGAFHLKYKDLELPLSYETWWTLVNSWVKVLSEKTLSNSNALLELTGIKNQLSLFCQKDSSTTAFDGSVEAKEKKALSRRLDTFIKSNDEAQKALKQVLDAYKGASNESIIKLERLLRLQAYRFSCANNRVQEINFRSYGTEYNTVAVHVDTPDVIVQALAIPFTMIKHHLIVGICFEQMDFMLNPDEVLRQFLGRMQDDSHKQPLYLICEGESIDDFQGEQKSCLSGSRSESSIDSLLSLGLEPKKMHLLEETYRKFTGDTSTYLDKLTTTCCRLLDGELRSEYLKLCAKGIGLSDLHYSWKETTFDALEKGLKWLLVCKCLKKGRDRAFEKSEEYVTELVDTLERHLDSDFSSLKAFLKSLFTAKFSPEISKVQQEQIVAFCRSLDIFTTTLYSIVKKMTVLHSRPLVCFHEFVGEDYTLFSVQQLHESMRRKQLKSPFEPTLTHSESSLVSEESRARLLVLSEIPTSWEKTVLHWQALNAEKKLIANDKAFPSSIQEYFLYQFLVATWVPGQSPQHYLSVMLAPLKKYLSVEERDAQRLQLFLEPLLLAKGSSFVENLDRFVTKLHRAGLYNSLAISFLKLFGPGVPEIFHCSDEWSFGFQGYPGFEVECDCEATQSMPEMFQRVESSAIKRSLIKKGLEFRKKNLWLLTQGEYVPFSVKGVRGTQVFAFGRKEGRSAAIALVSRLYLTLGENEDKVPIGSEIWSGHHVILDHSFTGNYQELFTGREYRLGGKGGEFSLPLEELFREMPFALLERV